MGCACCAKPIARIIKIAEYEAGLSPPHLPNPDDTHKANEMSIPRELIPWYPSIDEELCTNCGTCVDFCTHGVYAMAEVRIVVTAPNNCVVGCSGCESQCIPRAIRFPEMQQFVHTLRELRARYAQ